MKRRVLAVVVLLSGAALAAALIVSGSFSPLGESGLPETSGLLESDLEVEGSAPT